MNKCQVIALGALLHDIGKFWQRAKLSLKFTEHEVLTGEFIKFFYPDDEILHYITRFHHVEELDGQTVDENRMLAEVVCEADNLASSERTKDFEFELRGLRSIFSHVWLKEGKPPDAFYHPISKLGESMNLVTDDGLNLGDYEKHFEAFAGEFNYLKKNNAARKVNTVLSLLEKYFWCVPSAYYGTDPDIPLYDHLKVSAAIALCLYEGIKDKLPEISDPIALRNLVGQARSSGRKEHRYLFVCGDFSGIQNFIYRISSAKGVAKGLKGRSFYLQLLSDAVAKYILDAVDLPNTNLIYSSGGKFYLLLPKSAEERLSQIREELNAKLYKEFSGELFLGLGWIPLCGNDFAATGEGFSFSETWEEVQHECNRTKEAKFCELIRKDFEMVLAPSGEGAEKQRCDVCNQEDREDNQVQPREALTEDEEPRKVCEQCWKMEQLGNKLKDCKLIAEVVNDPAGSDQKCFHVEPLGLGVRYFFLRTAEGFDVSGKEVTYYNLNIHTYDEESFLLGTKLQQPEVECAFRFYGGNEFPDKDYNELAESRQGIHRLGVLRMDVDNLGRIFSEGLKDENGKPINTLSRVAVLSRSLNFFFSGYLNDLRRKYAKDEALIVYSGGDDLFLVGAWDPVLELAYQIRCAFKDYVQNPNLSISGGVTLIPKKFPIYKGAELAGEAEERAKDLRQCKDAFTFLEKPLGWEDFEIVREMKCELFDAIEIGRNEKKLNKGILDRLRRIYTLYDENKRRKTTQAKKQNISLKEIDENLRHDKWRWRMAYSLARYAESNKAFTDLIERLQLALLTDGWEGVNGERRSQQSIISYIDLPTRWVEFLTREEVE